MMSISKSLAGFLERRYRKLFELNDLEDAIERKLGDGQ